MFGRIQKDSPDFLQITRLMSRRFKTSAVGTFRKAKMLVQLGTAYTVLDAVVLKATGRFGEIDISPNLAKALYRILDVSGNRSCNTQARTEARGSFWHGGMRICSVISDVPVPESTDCSQ